MPSLSPSALEDRHGQENINHNGGQPILTSEASASTHQAGAISRRETLNIKKLQGEKH
jgi:hypothetical protein